MLSRVGMTWLVLTVALVFAQPAFAQPAADGAIPPGESYRVYMTVTCVGPGTTSPACGSTTWIRGRKYTRTFAKTVRFTTRRGRFPTATTSYDKQATL